MQSSKKGKNKPNPVHYKERAKFDKVDALRKKDEGHWVTINGQHKYVANDKKKK